MADTAVLDPDGEPTVVVARSYNDARAIGEAFREKGAVVIDLRLIDEAAGRRIVDFAAGAAFVSRGAIERIADRVLYLSRGDGSSVDVQRRFGA